MEEVKERAAVTSQYRVVASVDTMPVSMVHLDLFKSVKRGIPEKDVSHALMLSIKASEAACALLKLTPKDPVYFNLEGWMVGKPVDGGVTFAHVDHVPEAWKEDIATVEAELKARKGTQA